MKSLRSTDTFLNAILAITLISCTWLAQAKEIIAPSGVAYEIPENPDSLIASDTFYIGGIAGDDHPSIKVYGDGRVEVHYPDYMARSGDYVLKLGKEELTSLIRSILAEGLLEFDVEQTQSSVLALKARSKQQGALRYVSDPSTSVTELHLVSSPKNKNQNKKVNCIIRWTGLAEDLQRYPGQQGLQRLATVRHTLRTLADHHSLVKVENGGER